MGSKLSAVLRLLPTIPAVEIEAKIIEDNGRDKMRRWGIIETMRRAFKIRINNLPIEEFKKENYKDKLQLPTITKAANSYWWVYALKIRKGSILKRKRDIFNEMANFTFIFNIEK